MLSTAGASSVLVAVRLIEHDAAMSTELVLLGLGTTMSKAVLRSWLGGGLGGDASADIADIISGQVGGVIERRRAKRVFERIAEDIAAKLEPYIATEFGGVPDNERMAAIAAVNSAIQKADLGDMALLETNLDPTELEKTIRRAVGDLAAENLLSGAATSLYNLLLGEASAYLVELRMALPSFGPAALAELLKRETETHALLEEVLRRLPEPLEAGNAEDPDAGFDLKYRRRVAQDLDRLQLFGVTMGDDIRKYALSVAYITLSARTTSDKMADDVLSGSGPDEEMDSLRVDDILVSGNEHFIRGEAGSGKTTLLQWLAVKSARREFEGALDSWNGTIPFFLQLRRYVGQTLPPPQEYLQLVAPNLAEVMPDGWVHRVLMSGKALVLVDGVDELPEGERPKAREWLENLVSDFPGNRIVVTSRPPAVGDDWLKALAFSVAELQPMDVPDIASFISHWHEAAALLVPDAEREDILHLADRLTIAVRDRPQLRSLATSPLLCALLCALHRDRQRQLPSDRLELYRIALEMLLDRRDVEREVRNDAARSLTWPDKLILLSEFAHWLMINGRSDAADEEFERAVDRRLPRMSVGGATAAQVARYLLERSGVLRAPVVGRVDFIHRTFQEYLAARELVEQDSLEFLVMQAHEDQWRETVILAAGLARPPERESLLRGLVERGGREIAHRHRLHLLAVACLETVRELSPELREELRDLLTLLIPPTSMSEARAVASAGELAVPLLARYHGNTQYAATVAACVRGLGLIGSAEALEALKAFAPDRRVTVSRELIRAWQYFDPITYAEEVLAESPLDRGHYVLRDPALAPAMASLKNLRSLHVVLRSRTASLEYLDACAPLVTSINAERSAIEDLLPLRRATNLRGMYLFLCDGLISLEGVETTSLVRVDIIACDRLVDISALSGLPLQRLSIQRCEGIEDGSVIRTLDNLHELDLHGTDIRDFSFLTDGPKKIDKLDLSGTLITSVPLVAAPQALSALTISYCDELSDIGALGTMHELRHLDLSFTSEVTNISPISGCNRLRSLDVEGTGIRELPSLASLVHLEELDLSSTIIDDLGPVAELPSLRSLRVDGCKNVWDLRPLLELPLLNNLSVARSGLENWDLLVSLPLTRVVVDVRTPRAVLDALRSNGTQVVTLRS